ncbi:hypothetical protein [Seonamhaeicola maritimus]|uniref:Uncharacterized protein n=1 Tax=Seonamhaeicola maritimus TaxID=2591822 RepID=A0A5C7GGH6_9FLAO|nr:hypothetical protein [Seonamhaeicola maritimus]TXG36688.1 hypothetical protein FUA22_08895 [Seonamhaeicola maritimus]
MKKIYLLIILSISSFFKSCSQKTTSSSLIKIDWLQEYPMNSFIENLFDKEKYEKIKIPTDKTKTVYDRKELTVSINGYYINFLDYKNGKSIIRYIVNENTKIQYWNYFHKNGKIKLKGYTIGSVQKIGVWEKYSESGTLEAKINYEENRLSFYKIHELAKNKDWLKNELEFSFSKESGKWKIKDWTKKLDYIVDNNEKINKEKFKKDYLDEDMILY